jgi:hypothetical protein
MAKRALSRWLGCVSGSVIVAMIDGLTRACFEISTGCFAAVDRLYMKTDTHERLHRSMVLLVLHAEIAFYENNNSSCYHLLIHAKTISNVAIRRPK